MSLTAAELALLERARTLGGFETNKAALLAGLRALEGRGELSREELLAEIGRRLK